MNKKFVYQVSNNKKVILWCTVNQISSSNMFWCNHHHQGAHYMRLLKLQC